MATVSDVYRAATKLVKTFGNYRQPARTVEDFIRRLPRDTRLQVDAYPYHHTVGKGRSLVRAETSDGWKLRLVLDFSDALPQHGKGERTRWMARVNTTLACILEDVLDARPRTVPRVHGDPSHGRPCSRELYLTWLDNESPFEYR